LLSDVGSVVAIQPIVGAIFRLAKWKVAIGRACTAERYPLHLKKGVKENTAYTGKRTKKALLRVLRGWNYE
jgi:hypothetical protein